jgi:hypothetical protein
MAFFEWDVSSITSSKTTFAESDAGGIYYGTLFGAAGMWVKMPSAAPAIGDIILTAAATRGNNGLYEGRTTSVTTGGHGLGNFVWSGLQVASFQKGGRWIRLDRTTQWSAKMSAGSAKKRLRLHYTAYGDAVPLAAN